MLRSGDTRTSAHRRVVACLALALAVLAPRARCGTLTVEVPAEVGGTVHVGLVAPDGRLDSEQTEYIRARQSAEIALPAVPEGTQGPVVVGVIFEADDDRRWRTLAFDSEEHMPKSLRIAESDLFKPARATLHINHAGWVGVSRIAVVVRETDDYSTVHILVPRSNHSTLVLDGLKPGTVHVSATSDSGLPGRCVFDVQPGDDAVHTFSLAQPLGEGPELAPIFGTGGDVPSGLYAAVSVAIYVLIVLVWVVIATCFPALWSFFGLRQKAARAALSVAGVVIGIVLLGNGIALLLLEQVRYVPLVSATAGAQLVFLVVGLMAYISRRAWARSLAVMGLIFALLASLAFLPMFAFEGDDSDVGVWLTRSEVVLVCGAALLLTIVVAFDRRASAARERLPVRVCAICGKPKELVTGRCDCLPEAVGRPGRRVARLAILHADGRRRDVVVGGFTSIGKSDSCDLVLLDDEAVSARHASLFMAGGALCVRDERSARGTFVNGEKVTERVVYDGDEITVGDTWIVVEKL